MTNMGVCSQRHFLYVMIFVCLVFASLDVKHFIQGAETHQISPGIAFTVTVPTQGTIDFIYEGILSSASFLVMQVHTQYVQLNLTAVKPGTEQSIVGSSVGLVTQLKGNSSTNASWILSVVESVNTTVDTNNNVAVFVLLQQYATQVPIPGGCNQVFQLETDPNILLTPATHYTKVWFQWASAGADLPTCDSKENLTYDVFVIYVKEGDDSIDALFDKLYQMTTTQHIQQNAEKICTIKNDGMQKSVVTVTSQQRQGAVYAVVVNRAGVNTAASYVAVVTYACNRTSGECAAQYGALELVLTVASGFIGLFLLFMGHRFFKAEMMVFGFIATTLVCFLLLSLIHTLDDTVSLGIAAGLGVIGSLIWFWLWWQLAFPTVSVLVPGLTAGYLISSVFFFTPFANLSWWNTSVNYGLVFTCIALLFTVLLLCSPCTLNIVSCSVVGSYCIVMVIAVPLQSSLKLIFLSSVLHATVPDYAAVISVRPFQTNDIILATLWCVLCVMGCATQIFIGKGRPPFPHPRAKIPGTKLSLPDSVQRRSKHPASDDEREPLLSSEKDPPSYYSGSQQELNHPA